MNGRRRAPDTEHFRGFFHLLGNRADEFRLPHDNEIAGIADGYHSGSSAPPGPMAVLETKLFGSLEYQPDQLITLAAPLPGLPGTTKLLPVSQRVMAPFVFFQSLEEPAVCLLAAPAKVAKEDFRLELNPEDKALLRLPEPSLPYETSELGVFTFVSFTDSKMATANLLAPLVIHLTRNLAVQAIQPLDESLLRFPLDIAVAEAEPC